MSRSIPGIFRDFSYPGNPPLNPEPPAPRMELWSSSRFSTRKVNKPMMRSLIRPRLDMLFLTFSFALIGAMLTGATGQATEAKADSWSAQIWQSALDGNNEALLKQLSSIPDQGISQETRNRYEASLQLHQNNLKQAEADQLAARDEAVEKMREHVEADELAEALRQAVTLQTALKSMGQEFDQAFENEEVTKIVAWAEDELPRIEKQRDWLQAQELLFYLRTLYEDTTRTQEYTSHNDKLEIVNRRVALLARYAPERLHELRIERAEREGEDPPGEYVPRPGSDWQEQLEGIHHRTLKEAMRIASREHIEVEGWRPLLEGGLEAMELLATTPALEETFPKLGNQQRLDEWRRYLNRKRLELAQTPDYELNNKTCNRILDELLTLNDETLQLPDAAVCREFGDGAMYRLDRFSSIIWPDNVRRFQQATQGNFTGVGILIRHNEKSEILVVNPLEGTPAYFAGIRPEDIISEVNGRSTVGWSLNDAVDHITGPKGTEVTLGIAREGHDDLIQIPILRDVIKIYSVKGWHKDQLDESGEPIWDWYIDEPSGIAYIRMTQFTNDTYEDLRQAWHEINEQGTPRGVILDVRHNPGGLLTSAVRISNVFMEQGTIVTGEDKFQQRAWDQRAHASKAEIVDVPMVVLINQGSASASEIVAGSLQAYDRAVIIGERSYGKGSVQEVKQISGNMFLKLTTQYYRLPPRPGEAEGRLVHKRPGAKVWGVDPDIEVAMSPTQVIGAINLRQSADAIPKDDAGNPDPDSEDRGDINELLANGIDPQLQMALLILQTQTLGQYDDNVTRRAQRD